MSKKNPKLVVIDAPAVLHRAWHALPKLTDPQGRIINAVYGFTVLLLKLIREQKPDYLAVAFDTKAPTFRHKKYKEYKATRVPQPQEFYDQIPITKKIIQAFDIPIFACDGFEADDLIGTIVDYQKNKISKLKSLIITGDLDFLQLVDARSHVYFLRQGLSKIKIYDRSAVYQRFDLFPKQLIDFKALQGDASDNIKGAPGVGPKTALGLIKKFKTLENIYQYLEKSKLKNKTPQIKETLAKILIENKKNILLAKELVTIKKNVKTISLDKIKRLNNFDLVKIIQTFKKLGFNTLIKKIEKNGLVNQSKLF